METSLTLPTDANYIHSMACHPNGAIAIASHKSLTPDTNEGHVFLIDDLQTNNWQELPLQSGTGPAWAVTFLENGDVLGLAETFDAVQSTGGFYTWRNGQIFKFESIPDFIAGNLLHDKQGTLIGGNSFDWKQRIGHPNEGKIVWDTAPEATGPMVPLWRGTDESLYMPIAKGSNPWQLFNCAQ